MNLTEWAVRRPAFMIVLLGALVALGLRAWWTIPRLEDPALKIPTFIVVAPFPGANAIEMERLVARPLEDRLKELDDVDKVRAVVRDGVAVLRVEFYYGVDVERKYDDVLRQVAVAEPELPEGRPPVTVRRVQTIDVAAVQIGLVSETATYATLQDHAEILRRRLEAVPEVRQAERKGFPEKQVRVTLDVDQLERRGLPLEPIIEAVQGNNRNQPGGAVELGNRRFNVQTTGSYTTLDAVAATRVGGDGASAVRLGDVAEVNWTTEDRDVLARLNGARAVWVTVRPRDAQNLFDLSQGVQRVVEDFRRTLPADVRAELFWDQSVNVGERLGRLEHDFLLALGLVVLTLLPLGWRASLLVMLSIPLSLAMGLAMLQAVGYSLNQLSIVGSVIALGLLVDDSIVVVENIARFRREGHDAIAAAIAGTKQIAVAVVGTTATLLLAFLPLLLLPGGPGEYIRSMPLAVVFTVAASMVVALTIVPLAASLALGGKVDPEGNFLLRSLHRGIEGGYRPILRWCMGHKRTTLAVSALLVVGSFALVPQIGISLFPKAGLRQFLIQVEAEEGASVTATDAIVQRLEADLAARPQVAWFAATVGASNPQIYYNEIPPEQKANTAEIFVSRAADEPAEDPAFFASLRAAAAAIPGARIVVKELANGPPIEAPVAVRLLGDDLPALTERARVVEGILQRQRGTESINNPVRTARTDLRVVVDTEAADLHRVTEAEIDRGVRLALAGLDVARFREADGDEYSIQLAWPRGERADFGAWQALRIPTRDGAWVPLGQVAHLEMETAPAVIQRYNRERSVTVTAFVAEGYNTDQITADVVKALGELDWPTGLRWTLGGEAESRAESFGGIGAAIVIAAAGILAILVLEFGNFRGTLVVASVIPLGFVGGLVGLWLTGNSLSFMAAIGFVALIGMEIKNSILLVDFTNQLRSEGVPLDEAIERAGAVRFLPVVLTTLTALGALAPLALSGSGLYSPLAIVMMGGLLSSLLLSRLVTPVLYRLLRPGV